MKKLFFLFSLSAFLAACDPGSHFYNKVENLSGHKIILMHKRFSSGEVILEPGESVKADGGKMGSYYYLKNDYYKEDDYCPCGDSTFIYPADTALKITKEIQSATNWDQHDQKKKFDRGGEFYCTFTIRDSDIQKKN